MVRKFIDKKTIDKLKEFFRENQIPAYTLSKPVFGKSASYLSYKLNTETITEKEFNKVLDYLNITINDL
ncbi:hypothetical protein [Bartonella taylorii]|uniref:Uncharacterized protein n=1 Tax=Bartonella taylorii TaxID=33046 RepID=A0A9Q9DLB4_BARTA|nr:hypothetical protein [Bartonella taylorii]USP02155.1 hypothetical protein LAJ60_04460 [Bartonella taylorii]